MLKNLIYSTMLGATVLFASCSSNQNSGKSADNNSQSNAATIENVWKSYLNSNYIDCPKVADVDKAITHLYDKTATSAKLVITDFDGTPYTEDEAYHYNDGAEEAGDGATAFFFETLAMYENKAGGHTVLLYSLRPGMMCQFLSVFSYKNGELKRLADQFPSFSDNMFLGEPRDETTMWNLQGKEVVYLDYSCVIDNNSITKDGFKITTDGTTQEFKWNGEKFE